VTTRAPLRGVVDLHHHLLPGVDDGAADLGMAVAMARLAVAEGISTVVATPHTCDGVYEVPRPAAAAALAELNLALAAAELALTVRLAAEVHLHESIPERLAADPTLSLDGGAKYLLLELPHHGPPSWLPDFLFRLAAAGTTPIIAHPERNLAVRATPELAIGWAEQGALLQVTASSLVGGFGRAIQGTAERLLGAGAVHVLATDAHAAERRSPRVQEAFTAAAALLGHDGAAALFVRNPALVLAGAPRDQVVAPKAPPRRGWLTSLFR
jgi:protein-tyrosine phosphatase